ncbi:MAG TPA: FkbM family methyltransferase [Brevundimonas sp.]|nr:FkbM family methyltransferase [Brevundimonas sp.]
MRRLARQIWTLGLRARTGGRVMLDCGAPDHQSVIICFDDLDHFRGVRRLWRYEREFTDTFLEEARKATVVYDIGANVGIYSLMAAKVNPRAEIIAFEPEPHLTQLVERSARANGFANIEVKRICLGDADGEVQLSLAGVSGHHVAVAGEGKAITTPVARLDSLISRGEIAPPDLIKIDAEGYEFKILSGLGDMLARHQPRIVIEVHEHFMQRYGDSFDGLKALMRKAGYEGVLLRKPAAGEAEDVHRQSHYLFAPQRRA